jgi:hypothetical protein
LGFPFKIFKKKKKREKGVKTSVKGNIQWSNKGPHKELEISSSSMKRIGNVARGVYSSSKKKKGRDRQINGNRSSKKATAERGTYVSKIGNKSMHTILS